MCTGTELVFERRVCRRSVGYRTIPRFLNETSIPLRPKVRYHLESLRLQKGITFRLMSSELTSQEALRLTATFAFTADRMRMTDETFAVRAKICETASRVAFLQAYRIAQREEVFPRRGDTFRRAIFSVA